MIIDPIKPKPSLIELLATFKVIEEEFPEIADLSLPIDEKIFLYRISAEIRAYLEKRGLPISANDLLIAAHARSLNLTLVSNNTREFEQVPGLKLEDWLM